MDPGEREPLLRATSTRPDPVVSLRVAAVGDSSLSATAVGVLARILARPGSPVRLGDLGHAHEQHALEVALTQLIERGYIRVDAAGIHHVTDQPIEPGPLLVAGPDEDGGRPTLTAVTLPPDCPPTLERSAEVSRVDEQQHVNAVGADLVRQRLRQAREATTSQPDRRPSNSRLQTATERLEQLRAQLDQTVREDRDR